jgi:hypothetical protein
MHNFIKSHDTGFAWTEGERGSFQTDFFPLSGDTSGSADASEYLCTHLESGQQQ